jgi:hypothetical protein
VAWLGLKKKKTKKKKNIISGVDQWIRKAER